MKGTGVSRLLIQSDGKWSEGGKPLDSIGAQSVVDKLRELKAVSFAAKPGAEANLELIVVSSNGQRTEHVTVGTAGSGFVARREGEPQYYVLDPKAWSDLLQAAMDVKAVTPVPKPAASQKK